MLRFAALLAPGQAPKLPWQGLEAPLIRRPFSNAFANRISMLQDLAELNVLVGEAFASAVKSVANVPELDLIGSHGQTIYHHSRRAGALKATMQLGDGDVIAEQLNKPVVSDFRARDIAAGGQGAPLTPYADFVLFGGKRGRVVLNLGGIANLTILSEDIQDVRGFDSGPANAPLDRIALAEFGEKFDREGRHARQGTFDSPLLAQLLLEDPFLALNPPKSTGTETYGYRFVAMLREVSGASGNDLLRLATEYVVESIALQAPAGMKDLIIGGGGAKNTFLLERLRECVAPARVRLTDALGVPTQAREAMSFALLANDAISGLPTSIAGVTGASGPRILGKLCLPGPITT